jgi:predicted  nucleic acid-binding Zn-ribbon protein
MTGAKKVLVVLIVATLGIWGCAQGQAPNGASGQAERIKALEAKNAKLEDDFRQRAETGDRARKELVAVQEELKQLQQERQSAEQEKQTAESQLTNATRERDELKQQLALRTSERDVLVNQFEQFRKNIRELLGQAEASMPKPADHPVTSAVEPVSPGKS